MEAGVRSTETWADQGIRFTTVPRESGRMGTPNESFQKKIEPENPSLFRKEG